MSAGLRVITELVLNHTSDQHAWFQRARRAASGSPERDFYVWSDTPEHYREARIIFKDFEPSNWTWDPVAKALFLAPLLFAPARSEFRQSRACTRRLLQVVDFWLEHGRRWRCGSMPCRIFTSAKARTAKTCQRRTPSFENSARTSTRSSPTACCSPRRTNGPRTPRRISAHGDECHMNFHFPLMPRLFMALQMEDRFPIIDILEQTPAIPDNCQWAIFLRNHDELTLGDGDRRRARLHVARLCRRSARAHQSRHSPPPGAAAGQQPPQDRADQRRCCFRCPARRSFTTATKSAWATISISATAMASARRCNGARIATPASPRPIRSSLFLPVIIDPEYHYETVNVENQQRNVSSLFWWMRAVARGAQSSPGVEPRRRSNFCSRKMPKCSRICADGMTARPCSWLRISRGLRRWWNSTCRLRGLRAGGTFRPEQIPADQGPALRFDSRAARSFLVRAARRRREFRPGRRFRSARF